MGTSSSSDDSSDRRDASPAAVASQPSPSSLAASSGASAELTAPVEAETDAAESPDGADARQNPLKRKKKATYAIRKEEKLRLERDIEALEAQLVELKRQRADHARQKKRKNSKAVMTEKDVRSITRRQEMSLVSVHSALSGYVAGQEHLPFEMWIYLGTDHDERRATLAALKEQKMRAAQEYLRERSRFLDPMRTFAEHTRFATPQGDFCALRFDITPYEGVSDARKVYDALTHYFSNMEIWLTEMLGDVTIRENDETAGKGIVQLRLVSALHNGVQLEMNKVMYTEFFKAADSDNGSYGLYTADYVDKDELYPYCPQDRVRIDVTGAMTIREMKRPAMNTLGEETIVVITRVCQLKLRSSGVTLPPGTMHDMQEGVGNWEDVMMRTVRQLVYK